MIVLRNPPLHSGQTLAPTASESGGGKDQNLRIITRGNRKGHAPLSGRGKGRGASSALTPCRSTSPCPSFRTLRCLRSSRRSKGGHRCPRILHSEGSEARGFTAVPNSAPGDERQASSTSTGERVDPLCRLITPIITLASDSVVCRRHGNIFIHKGGCH